MKWLVVLFALFVHGQVSAAGLCKKNDNGEMTNKCIAGWNGATDHLAYAGALSAMLDKFLSIIVYDSYDNAGYWFGMRCRVDPGDLTIDPPEPSIGCTGVRIYDSVINSSLSISFHRTLKTASVLMDELNWVNPALSYRVSSFNVPAKNDKEAACSVIASHQGIAPLWIAFADSFRQDYDAYNDQYRKKLYKNWFQGIKRLYGFYANRMKRLARNIKREYRCEV